MRRLLLLKRLFAVGVVFVLFQIIFLTYFLQTTNTLTDKGEEFVLVYKSLGIPLFLMELDIISSDLAKERVLSALRSRHYLTFGLISRHNSDSDIERLKEKCENLGYKVQISQYNLSRPSKVVTSHLFLVHEYLTVHIVIFFKRTPTLVWSTEVGDITHVELQGKPFVDSAYLLENFDLKERGDILIPDPVERFVQSIPTSRFIECDAKRAALFKKEYPQDDDEEARTFQRKARQIIARAKRYLDDLDIQFWLSSGTCLGWYRQCDIISYSRDVDFGIWIKDYKPQLIPVFEHGGFFLKHIFGKVSDSYELSFQAGDIKLDLFFFYEENNTMWNGGTHHETGQKYKYTFPRFNLCWTEFLELFVRVPCPPGPYIEANYGKNWFEPVKHWDWNKSPPNVKENGFWDKEEWSDVIQVF